MEFETLDLGDKRRNKRAIKMMAEFVAMPTGSIPQACGDWADTMGAYWFFQNDAVQWADILQPHIERSVARMAAHPVVLCIQDTTSREPLGVLDAWMWGGAKPAK
jgi:Transposase DNA-binding